MRKILSSIMFVMLLSIFGGVVNAAESTLYVEGEVPLYNEPSLITESGATIKDQTVEVLEARSNGWYKIKTWLGEKWIAPKGIKIALTKDEQIYHSQSLTDEAVGAEISPQTVTVHDQTADGWWLVDTWLDSKPKWIAPNGIKEYLNKSVSIYNTASFLSPAGASLDPQTITVVDQRTDGWWLIKTWLGEKWIAPNGISLVLSDIYPMYNEPSFSKPAGASVGNQTVKAVNQRSGGWWQVKTWLGDKWINTELQELDFRVPLNTSYRLSSEFGMREDGMHYGMDMAKAGSGIEIVASESGRVDVSHFGSPGNYGGYGNVVVITHKEGSQTYQTLYAHLDSRLVSVGSTVKKGQVIGYMGNTGASRGQHLHFELHKGTWNGSKSNAVDPAPYIFN